VGESCIVLGEPSAGLSTGVLSRSGSLFGAGGSAELAVECCAVEIDGVFGDQSSFADCWFESRGGRFGGGRARGRRALRAGTCRLCVLGKADGVVAVPRKDLRRKCRGKVEAG